MIIPNSLKEIGNYAFKGCAGIKEIRIPKSVQKIGKSAFDSCRVLKRIVIPRHLYKNFESFVDVFYEDAAFMLKLYD